MGGHREKIFDVAFSPDSKYVATSSQDSTVCIWDATHHRLVATLSEGNDVKFECLRVAWLGGGMSSTLPTNRERVIEEEEEGNEVAAYKYEGAVRDERYLLAMASADGIVRLWSATSKIVDLGVVNGSNSANDNNNNNDNGGEEKLSWKCVSKLDHYLWEKTNDTDPGNNIKNADSSTTDDDDDVNKDEDDEDRPQIYGLQFVHSSTVALSNMNILLVSTNDCIYIWNIVIDDTNYGEEGGDDEMNRRHHRKFLPILSIRFSHLDEDGQFESNQFGGPRNPDNMLFIFDMQYSVTNDLLGTALSDGTCRITSLHHNHTNGDVKNNNSPYYHQERCILGLPKGYFGETGGHLTALAWDKTGTRVATCIGSGRVVLWLLQAVNNNGIEELHPACLSILEGGHGVGRPLYGAKYCGGSDEDLLLTWGVDGEVCVWDSYSIGTVTSPLCKLISHLKNYPIYALDITDGETHIAVAGGGDDGGFFGIPIYIYDL